MDSFADLCSCVRECNCDELVDKLADCFPMMMDIHASLPASEFHAIANVLKKVKKQLKSLRLAGRDSASNAFVHIASAIKEMPGSVSRLQLFMHLKISYTLFSYEGRIILCSLPVTYAEQLFKCCYKYGATF